MYEQGRSQGVAVHRQHRVGQVERLLDAGVEEEPAESHPKGERRERAEPSRPRRLESCAAGSTRLHMIRRGWPAFRGSSYHGPVIPSETPDPTDPR